MLMVFLGTALIVVLTSIFFIYKFLTLCKMHLELKAISLAAIMPFLFIFAIRPWISYPTVPYYAVIVLAVFLTAFAATFYNGRLLEGKQNFTKSRHGTVVYEQFSPVWEKAPEPPESPPQITIAEAHHRKANKIAEKRLTKIIGDLSECLQSEQDLATIIQVDPHMVEQLLFYQPPQYAVVHEHLLSYGDGQLCFYENRLWLKLVRRCGLPTAKTCQRKYNLPAQLAKSEVQYAELYLLNREKVKVEKLVEKAQSIEEVLDYVYRQNRKRKYAFSLYALKCSLPKYRESPDAPFLCIEMSNIYKKFGAFNKAAFILRSALYLSVVCEDTGMRQEFKNQILYLQKMGQALAGFKMAKLSLAKERREHMQIDEASD